MTIRFSYLFEIMTLTTKNEKHFIRNPDLVATDMDGDTVMMDIEQGKYYGISSVGSRVWELLENPVTLSEIVRTICAEFDVGRSTCGADMMQFLSDLESHKLISQAMPE